MYAEPEIVFKSSNPLDACRPVKNVGFSVETGLAGMPTSFGQ